MNAQELSDYAYDCDYVAPDSPEPDYRYVVKLVLRTTLYFRNGHSPEIRNALRECFQEYFACFGGELRWGWDPQPVSNKPTPWQFDESLVDAALASFSGIKADDALELGFASSLNPKYVGDYGIECFTRPDWEQEIGRDISYLTFWVPCNAVLHGRWNIGTGDINNLLFKFCDRLKPVQGCAGFSLALPHEYARWEPYELELAERYYGLEIGNPVNTLGMIQNWNGIKSLNWYTILGERYVAQLGGARAIQSELTGPVFHVHEIAGGGLIIRAGDEPEMAPVAKGLPPLYVTVNNIARSVRTKEIRSMGLGSNAGELRFNKRLTDLWMRRFDAPGIWPPVHP
ncbi:hypothetical protein DP57_5992 [Burkholderia pseudomallei]|uniref:type VI immunity family protein n=1 Tax=Burkholderia pseudomallei TaxID=28450 RepID=UPI00050E9688|nr:type VI immunity family protein [Burkholderia pseudomallei]KGC70064.1 hypothetical protein DP57_5992 [Burkholderia pseudomallei]